MGGRPTRLRAIPKKNAKLISVIAIVKLFRFKRCLKKVLMVEFVSKLNKTQYRPLANVTKTSDRRRLNRVNHVGLVLWVKVPSVARGKCSLC
jgi:hypothetical protein